MNELLRAAVYSSIVCIAARVPCVAADVNAQLLACRAISDPTARLDCFDRAGTTSPAGTAASPAAPPPATAVPPTAPPGLPSTSNAANPPVAPLDAQQQFGLPEKTVVAKEVAAGTRAADAQKLQTRVAVLVTAADRRLVFMLENNQVWRQLTSEGELLAKQGDEVTISRGLLGSYWLQLPSGRGCKVTRLR